MTESKEYHHYQGASYKVLLALLADLADTTKAFRFVDIGCGKGRAVLVAEYCGYNKLTGIDLDPELIKEAIQNLQRYPFKRLESQIDFRRENALTYDYDDEASLYFLFNPFGEAVMESVLKRILDRNNQEFWVVYMNPLYPAPLYSAGLQFVKEYKTARYSEALIFRRPAINY